MTLSDMGVLLMLPMLAHPLFRTSSFLWRVSVPLIGFLPIKPKYLNPIHPSGFLVAGVSPPIWPWVVMTVCNTSHVLTVALILPSHGVSGEDEAITSTKSVFEAVACSSADDVVADHYLVVEVEVLFDLIIVGHP